MSIVDAGNLLDDGIVKSGVYCIKNTITGKVYIGSAVDLKKRKIEHFSTLASGMHSNRYLLSAYRKHGAAAFEFIVLELVPDKSNLTTVEQKFMDARQSYIEAFGYNLRLKAESNLGMKVSAEGVERMRRAQIGKKHSPEHIANRLASAIASGGIERARASKIGKKQSAEHVAKRGASMRASGGYDRVRLSNIGRKHSPEDRQKISDAQTGRTHSTEWRENISKSMVGKNSIFTKGQVAQIRADRALGMTYKKIAAKYGCALSTAYFAANCIGAFYAECA